MFSKIMSFMQSKMISCEQLTRLTSESLERDISFKEKMNMKLHIMFCQWCRRYEKQITFINRAIHNYIRQSNQSDKECHCRLSDKSRDSIRSKIKNNL